MRFQRRSARCAWIWETQHNTPLHVPSFAARGALLGFTPLPNRPVVDVPAPLAHPELAVLLRERGVGLAAGRGRAVRFQPSLPRGVHGDGVEPRGPLGDPGGETDLGVCLNAQWCGVSHYGSRGLSGRAPERFAPVRGRDRPIPIKSRVNRSTTRRQEPRLFRLRRSPSRGESKRGPKDRTWGTLVPLANLPAFTAMGVVSVARADMVRSERERGCATE